MAALRHRPLFEVLVVFAAVAVGTAAIMALPRVVPGLEGYGQLLVGALFLLTAVKLARREPEGMRRHGIDLAGMLTPPDADDERAPGPLGLYDLGRALRGAAPAGLCETAVALAAAAITFPPFIFAYGQWFEPTREFALHLRPDLAEFALTQLLVVALPEEALFRGYVQTRLAEVWPTERTLLGAKIHPLALVVQAALFALVHLASGFHPAKLAVFFPGLMFGWLRSWRGGIGAAMLFHALCNILSDLLEKSWLGLGVGT